MESIRSKVRSFSNLTGNSVIHSHSHEFYGQYLTREAANEMTKPAAGTIDTITRWLDENNVDFDHGTNTLSVRNTVCS